MTSIGKLNKLRVVKKVDFGVFLDGEELGNILLADSDLPGNYKIGEMVEVFILYDSKGRPLATTQKPKVMVGQFAFLKVATVTPYGAFMDWGVQRNLLVHGSEQKQKMEERKSYIIYCYLEEGVKDGRIAATTKWEKFLDVKPLDYKEGQEVDLLICEETDLGYKAIINNSHWGLLYKDEVFHKLKTGQLVKGFIKNLRMDAKIDLCLHKPGHEKVGDLSDQIYQKLKAQGGFISVTDKSPATIIYEMFGVSKKTFKKAVGALYKRRLISIEEEGITLIEAGKPHLKKKK